MKLLLPFLLLALAATAVAQPVPPTTAFTRYLLSSTNQAEAQARIGIPTNGQDVVYNLNSSTNLPYNGLNAAARANITNAALQAALNATNGIPTLISNIHTAIGGEGSENVTQTGLANATYPIAASALTGIVPSANGGAGTVNGLLKANGSGTVSAAVSGTDYVVPGGGVANATNIFGELTARSWWVATNGNNSNSGNQGSPKRNIWAGNALASAGDTVHVGPGVYEETITNKNFVTYDLARYCVVSNQSLQGTIMLSAGTNYVNVTGQGDLRNDVLFGGAVYELSDIAAVNAKLKVHTLAEASTLKFYLYIDLYDGTGEYTNIIHNVLLDIEADTINGAVFSHTYAPRLYTGCTNFYARIKARDARFAFEGNEAGTNWVFDFHPTETLALNASGIGSHFVNVTGGRVYLTNSWYWDGTDLAKSTLALNECVVYGTNMPPAGYVSGQWKTGSGAWLSPSGYQSRTLGLWQINTNLVTPGTIFTNGNAPVTLNAVFVGVVEEAGGAAVLEVQLDQDHSGSFEQIGTYPVVATDAGTYVPVTIILALQPNARVNFDTNSSFSGSWSTSFTQIIQR